MAQSSDHKDSLQVSRPLTEKDGSTQGFNANAQINDMTCDVLLDAINGAVKWILPRAAKGDRRFYVAVVLRPSRAASGNGLEHKVTKSVAGAFKSDPDTGIAIRPAFFPEEQFRELMNR